MTDLYLYDLYYVILNFIREILAIYVVDIQIENQKNITVLIYIYKQGCIINITIF